MSLKYFFVIASISHIVLSDFCDYSSPWQDWYFKGTSSASLSLRSECNVKNPFDLSISVLRVSELDGSTKLRGVCPSSSSSKFETKFRSFKMHKQLGFDFDDRRILGDLSSTFQVSCNLTCSAVPPKSCDQSDYKIKTEKMNYHNPLTHKDETCFAYYIKKSNKFDCFLQPATMISIPIKNTQPCPKTTTTTTTTTTTNQIQTSLNEKKTSNPTFEKSTTTTARVLLKTSPKKTKSDDKMIDIKFNSKNNGKPQLMFKFGSRRRMMGKQCPCPQRSTISWIETPLGVLYDSKNDDDDDDEKKMQKKHVNEVQVAIDEKRFAHGVYPIVICFKGEKVGENKKGSLTFVNKKGSFSSSKAIKTPDLCVPVPKKKKKALKCQKFDEMHERCSVSGCCYCLDLKKCVAMNALSETHLNCNQACAAQANTKQQQQQQRRRRRLVNNLLPLKSECNTSGCKLKTDLKLVAMMFKHEQPHRLYSSSTNLKKLVANPGVFQVHKNTLKWSLNLEKWCFVREGNQVVFELKLGSAMKGYNSYMIPKVRELFAETMYVQDVKEDENLKGIRISKIRSNYVPVIVNNIFLFVLPKFGISDHGMISVMVDTYVVNDETILRLKVPYHSSFQYESLLYIIRRQKDEWTISEPTGKEAAPNEFLNDLFDSDDNKGMFLFLSHHVLVILSFFHFLILSF